MLSTRLSCAFVVLAAASLSFASCNPNFDGHPVSILYADTAGLEELAVASDTAGANIITKAVNDLNPEFLVENSGHFPTSYLIKLPVPPPAPKLNTIDNTGEDDAHNIPGVNIGLSAATHATPVYLPEASSGLAVKSRIHTSPGFASNSPVF
ncbi:hypothetical protein B0H14DRAFT_3494600 [Mycena olivaceomarginata]|nr:hypothetical protein B0H14DRAFT_3494600 [Mycena olivaceomarginata]